MRGFIRSPDNTFETCLSGDFDQKPYVSGDADCVTTPLCGDEDYILLACDGFFDSVKPSEVPHVVLDALQRSADPEDDPAAGLSVAQHLVAHAKAAGSTDNITVVVVFLRPPEELLAPPRSTGTSQEEQSSRSADGPQQ